MNKTRGVRISDQNGLTLRANILKISMQHFQGAAEFAHVKNIMVQYRSSIL